MQWLVAWILAVLELGAAEYNLAGQPGQGYVVEVMLGQPRQKLNVLIDTGSSNFAVAGAPNANLEVYYHRENSTSLADLKTPVSVFYTQGSWAGELASELVYFPTLNSVPEVRCDIAFITESVNLFTNGSNWQGILGVGYPLLSEPDSSVLMLIDALQKTNKDKTMAFSLILCGSRDPYHIDHYGSFEILNNVVQSMEGLVTTPVIRERFYEVMMTGLQVGDDEIDVACADLNGVRTIVDSGTTNIRVPQLVFDKVLALIKSRAEDWGAVREEFWTKGLITCWNQPRQATTLPSLSIRLMHSVNEEFVLHLPPASYIRQVGAAASSEESEPEFCYTFGIEATSGGSVLGVAAMEGFEVIFNRTGGTVGFRKSPCGPNVTLIGPYKQTKIDNLLNCLADEDEPMTMLQMAAYVISTLLIVATIMFVYLFVQWLKDKYFRCHARGPVVSLSHTSLINED